LEPLDRLARLLHLFGAFTKYKHQMEGKTMKTTTTKLTIAAAFLALATGFASAQTVKADIPFAFRAGGKMMPAGEYTLQTTSSTVPVLALRNYEARQAVALVPSGQADSPKAAGGEAVITFECGASRCSLVEIWTGNGAPARTFRHENPARGDQPVLKSIRLMPTTR
jgi:hypothetical protein